MIPKIIHAIWLGHGPQNEVILRCVETWHEVMPDYKIMWWTEDNVDIDSLPAFARHAYNNKRWAYVADVIRFKVLHEYGGIYLDTDMLMLRNPTNLFNELVKQFDNKTDISIWGMEDDIHISCGIIACDKGNTLMLDLYNYYDGHYRTHNMNVVIEVPKIVTQMISKSNYNFKALPPEYFYPLPAANKKEDYRKYITPNSYAVHLWNYSWQTPFMRIMRKVKIVQFGKAIVPKGLRPFVINILRRLKLN